jgi:hypothetical protein
VPDNVADGKIKKISAKSIMADLKAGLTDKELMERYAISFQALQDLFAQMIKAKLATQAYFNRRAAKQASIGVKPKQQHTCPYCGFVSDESFAQCPQCDQDASEWLDTMELTKILDGSFG